MKYIPNAVSVRVGRQILIAQKHSPAVLFVAGVGGVVVSTVLACRATLKLDEVLDETQKNMELIRTTEDQRYSEMNRQRDMSISYVRGAVAVTKLYAPAITVGVISVGCLVGSHRILTKRNFALTAAYAALEKGFTEYRQRVVAELGEEKDRDFRYGSELVEVTDPNTGKVKKTKVRGPGGHSVYARLFDDRSHSWNPIPEYNMLFLKAQQNHANDLLQSRGHVLLNDVYDSLGLDRTVPGCVVGWVKDNGDNYIDFGVFDGRSMDKFYDFVSGVEGAIWLDFNVDGNVYELI